MIAKARALVVKSKTGTALGRILKPISRTVISLAYIAGGAATRTMTMISRGNIASRQGAISGFTGRRLEIEEPDRAGELQHSRPMAAEKTR
jgi:uncharacterized protein (DUF697 family)